MVSSATFTLLNIFLPGYLKEAVQGIGWGLGTQMVLMFVQARDAVGVEGGGSEGGE